MNVRYLVGLLMIVFLFSACNEKKEALPKAPEKLIPSDTMAQILSEVQLTEAYLSHLSYNVRGRSDSAYHYYRILFDKYHISKQDFLDNMDYYSRQQDKIQDIYEQAIVSLNKLKAKDIEIRLQMKMDSLRQDSILREKEKARLDSLKAEKNKN